MKIVELKQNQSGANVIERLEECLQMAKERKIDNCVIILTYSDGSVGDCWANQNDPFRVVGAIESVKSEFITDCIEKR